MTEYRRSTQFLIKFDALTMEERSIGIDGPGLIERGQMRWDCPAYPLCLPVFSPERTGAAHLALDTPAPRGRHDALGRIERRHHCGMRRVEAEPHPRPGSLRDGVQPPGGVRHAGIGGGRTGPARRGQRKSLARITDDAVGEGFGLGITVKRCCHYHVTRIPALDDKHPRGAVHADGALPSSLDLGLVRAAAPTVGAPERTGGRSPGQVERRPLVVVP